MGAPLKARVTGVHLDPTVTMDQRLLSDLHSSPFFFNRRIYYKYPITVHHYILGTGGRGAKTGPISALVLTWPRAVLEEPH